MPVASYTAGGLWAAQSIAAMAQGSDLMKIKHTTTQAAQATQATQRHNSKSVNCAVENVAGQLSSGAYRTIIDKRTELNRTEQMYECLSE